jgi:hypothetical protein
MKAIDVIELRALCAEVLANAGQILDQCNPNNPEMDGEAFLLLRFLELLYAKLEIGRFTGLHPRGAPTVAPDLWQKIMDVLAQPGRLQGWSGRLDDIQTTITTFLLDPALKSRM